MTLRPPLSPTARAELRQQAASRIMVADDFTLLQIAAPLGLLDRPAGHDAGRPYSALPHEGHQLGQLTENP